jgi:hypothetical protein
MRRGLPERLSASLRALLREGATDPGLSKPPCGSSRRRPRRRGEP